MRTNPTRLLCALGAAIAFASLNCGDESYDDYDLQILVLPLPAVPAEPSVEPTVEPTPCEKQDHAKKGCK